MITPTIGNIGISSGGNYSLLKELDLSDDNLLDEAFPEYFGNLFSLVDLDLNNNPFTVLPQSINRLSRLRDLYLNDCKNLKKLGAELSSSLELVHVDDCTSRPIFCSFLT